MLNISLSQNNSKLKVLTRDVHSPKLIDKEGVHFIFQNEGSGFDALFLGIRGVEEPR
jgi:hypothetical protein